MVVDFGLPDRVGVTHAKPGAGTRLNHGNNSKYRLEANRIAFSYLDAKAKKVLTQVRADLEAMGNQVPLEKFSRKSQMAYWLNLHNALVIEQIALHYPTKYPEEIRIADAQLPLHEAKLTKIHGVKLSLKNIRQDIVHRNWRNPNAIYGFYRGTVGGPNIQNMAYTAANIEGLLEKGAEQFVNSLRGVAKTKKTITVSAIYAESKPLFPSWPTDLLAHLSRHSGDVVTATLATALPIDPRIYDPKVADFAGGRPVRSLPRPSDVVTQAEQRAVRRGSTEVKVRGAKTYVTALLEERDKKNERLRRRELRDLRFKKRKGTVVVEEIEDTTTAEEN